jgi:hypothetical protein
LILARALIREASPIDQYGRPTKLKPLFNLINHPDWISLISDPVFGRTLEIMRREWEIAQGLRYPDGPGGDLMAKHDRQGKIALRPR